MQRPEYGQKLRFPVPNGAAAPTGEARVFIDPIISVCSRVPLGAYLLLQADTNPYRPIL